MKRNSLVLILLGIMLLLLTGCGKKPASASALENDLYNSGGFSRFSNELGMNITDFEIEKRQTTTESKVDIVWVSVKASGDTVKGEMYYKMTYNLYNDGWLLETIEDDNVDSWHFEPLCGVPDAEIADYMPEEAEILENTVDLDTATQTVTYTYEEPHLYCDVTYKKQLVFDFGDIYYSFGMCEPGTWGFRDEVDAGSYEDWHGIEGTWQYTNTNLLFGKTETYTLVIDDFSPGSHAFDEPNSYDGSSDHYTVSGSYRYDMDYYSRKDFVSWANENNMLDGRAKTDNGEMTHHITANMVQHSDASYVTNKSMGITIHYDSAPTIWAVDGLKQGTVELTKIS